MTKKNTIWKRCSLCLLEEDRIFRFGLRGLLCDDGGSNAAVLFLDRLHDLLQLGVGGLKLGDRDSTTLRFTNLWMDGN